MTGDPSESAPRAPGSRLAALYGARPLGDRLIELLGLPTGSLLLTGAAGDDGPPEILIRLLAELAGEEPDDVVRAFGDRDNVLARVFGKLLTRDRAKKRGRGRPRADGVRLVVWLLSDQLFAVGVPQAEVEQRIADVLKRWGVNKQPSQVRALIENARAQFGAAG